MNLYLYGCGGHAKVILDILHQQNRTVQALVADDPPANLADIYGVPIWTATEAQSRIAPDHSNWIVAIGNNLIRQQIAEKLSQAGYQFATAIHPSAQIGLGVEIEPGTVVMANAVINPDSQIGAHVIVNTSATIDHDCCVADYCHIAPKSSLCGQVCLENGVFLGIGTCVCPSITIGAQTICGAGSVVVNSLPAGCVAYGCPAKVMRQC